MHKDKTEKQNLEERNPILKKSMNTGKESQILLPAADLKAQRKKRLRGPSQFLPKH